MANANGIMPDSYTSAAYAAKIGQARAGQGQKAGQTQKAGEMAAGRTGGNDSLGFQDFLQLIVAQMKNQDMMNPMNDTEFIGQMAQMAVMQSVNNMTAVSATQYASSLLGKEITAAVMDDKGLQTTEGVVTGVSMFEGQPIIYVGQKGFTLGNIMAVGKLPKKEDPPETEGDTQGGEDHDQSHEETEQTGKVE